jgi:hypothetical protein
MRLPRGDFIPLAIETYECLHPHFDFLRARLYNSPLANLLVLSMLISCYKQRVSIILECAQTITILQWVAMLSHNFSSFPHILANAPTSLADLWHMMPF